MRWKPPAAPKPHQLGLPGDAPIGEVKPIQLKDGYLNPFEASLSINSQHILDRAATEETVNTVQMEGGPSTEVYVPPPRKWKTNLSKAQVTKIQQHKEKYGKYLEMHNQT